MESNQFTGGIARTRDLKEQGIDGNLIARAVASGTLERLRPGWYATVGADESVKRAVRSGGALTCASAIAFHGGWDVTAGVLHVRRDHNRTMPLPAGLKRCHALSSRFEVAPAQAVDDLATALSAAWRCLDREDLIVVCDSLVHRKICTVGDIRSAWGWVRGREDRLALIDAAESGTETMVRLRLRAKGVQLKPQVWLRKDTRVDFLVGERLVIEVDSREHHTGEERYQADRRRDLELRSMGYIVVRLTYQQVVHDWPATEQALLAMIRRGDQWWGARRGTKPAA